MDSYRNEKKHPWTVTSQEWIASIVDEVHAEMQVRDTDVRYGVIGFGEIDNMGTTTGDPMTDPFGLNDDEVRYARSQLVGPTGAKGLFTSSDVDVAQTIGSELASFGYGPA